MLNKLYEMLNNKYDAEYYDEGMYLYLFKKDIHIYRENNKDIHAYCENNESIEVYLYDGKKCDESRIFTDSYEAYLYIDNFLEN